MKRLCVYDMDGCILHTPEKEEGKQIWKEKTGQEFPYNGWWSKKESLNTEIFNIKPNPPIYSKFKKDITNFDTYVIILTGRFEKLRPEVENVLNLNNIQPDNLHLKKGSETKGDVVLEYVKKYPEIEKIDVYDDFAGGMEHKIKEFTEIRNKLPENIEYNIFYVNNDNIKLMESNNNILNFIHEELKKIKQ
jgi:hypothetical protein